MNHWKRSGYTSVIECESGDILLYNSFMGAIARIPAHQSKSFQSILHHGIREQDLDRPSLRELCDGGFFVLSNLDERKLVSEVLDKERKSVFRMIILPHENCNFRCVYCYERFERGQMEPPVVAGLKVLAERKAREYEGISVSWFGGEPLLALDVISELATSFLRSCQQNGIPYLSSITTNGYLLSADVVDALLRCEVRHFQVTLDGPETIHDAMRKLANGKGTYRRILDNLARMRNRDDDFKVRVRVNFNNASIQLMEQWLAREIAPLFADDHRFVIRFHAVGKWGGVNDSTLDTCDDGITARIRSELLGKSLNFGFSAGVAKELLKPHGSVCYAAKESSLVVGSDGAIYKCTVAFDDPRNHIGRLKGDGELVIDPTLWNLWVKVDDEVLARCTSCPFYPTCQSRKCPLTAMDYPKPVCPMTRTEYESLVKLVAFSGCR